MKAMLAILLTLLPLAAFAADSPKPIAVPAEPPTFYAPGLSFDLFASARTFDLNDARGGAGLGANWFFANNLGIGIEALTENASQSFVDYAQVSALWRLTSGRAALNITGGVGYSLDGPAEVVTNSKTTSTRKADDELYVAVGVGPEYALTRWLHAFAEGRAQKPIEGGDIHAVFRTGLRLSF